MATKHKSIRIHPSTYQAIKVLAAKQGIPLTKVLDNLLAKELLVLKDEVSFLQ